MGLDINFYRIKRADFDRYNEDFKNWKESEPESCRMSNSEFDALSAEDKLAAEKEIQAHYDAMPEFGQAYGVQEVGYFRKVNFLLPYFGYGKNCSFCECTLEDVETLLSFCRKILKHKSKKQADYLLPTESGFFYGSTEYDESYFEDVKDVREWCKRILKEFDNDSDEDENGYVLLMFCWW